MGTIRIETDGKGDLSQVHEWFSRHRGAVVELDRTRRLTFGVPITGASAVIIAVTVQDEGTPRPQMGGVLRAISNRSSLGPVRLVFEGRSPSGLARIEAETIATDILEAVATRITPRALVEKVA